MVPKMPAREQCLYNTIARDEGAPRLEREGLELVFQAHDFFKPQPARPCGFENGGKGGVYFLRRVLHDLGDEKRITILRYFFRRAGACGARG